MSRATPHPESKTPISEETYSDLRDLARRAMHRLGSERPLLASELVNEVWLRLDRRGRAHFRDRVHFLAAAAQAMRQVLIDEHRRAGAQRRGGDRKRVSFSFEQHAGEVPCDDFLAVHEAIEQLGGIDPMQGRIVRLRFFGGMSSAETAAHLGLSLSSAEREWRHARAWLRHRLGADRAPRGAAEGA